MTDRIIVKEQKAIRCDDFLNKTFREIIEVLNKYEDAGWHGIVYAVDYDTIDFYLYKHRLENDDEYNRRLNELAEEEIKSTRNKEKRRRMYEKLKKEFE